MFLAIFRTFVTKRCANRQGKFSYPPKREEFISKRKREKRRKKKTKKEDLLINQTNCTRSDIVEIFREIRLPGEGKAGGGFGEGRRGDGSVHDLNEEETRRERGRCGVRRCFSRWRIEKAKEESRGLIDVARSSSIDALSDLSPSDPSIESRTMKSAFLGIITYLHFFYLHFFTNA